MLVTLLILRERQRKCWLPIKQPFPAILVSIGHPWKETYSAGVCLRLRHFLMILKASCQHSSHSQEDSSQSDSHAYIQRYWHAAQAGHYELHDVEEAEWQVLRSWRSLWQLWVWRQGEHPSRGLTGCGWHVTPPWASWSASTLQRHRPLPRPPRKPRSSGKLPWRLPCWRQRWPAFISQAVLLWCCHSGSVLTQAAGEESSRMPKYAADCWPHLLWSVLCCCSLAFQGCKNQAASLCSCCLAIPEWTSVLTLEVHMQVTALRAALKEVPEETKDNVEKKQARTYEELLAEQAEQEEVQLLLLTMTFARSDGILSECQPYRGHLLYMRQGEHQSWNLLQHRLHDVEVLLPTIDIQFCVPLPGWSS